MRIVCIKCVFCDEGVSRIRVSVEVVDGRLEYVGGMLECENGKSEFLGGRLADAEFMCRMLECVVLKQCCTKEQCR